MKILTRCALLLPGVCVAAWLRMTDGSLAMQSWGSLLQQPPRQWVGALLGSPLLELFHYWPAHLLAAALYTGVARLRQDRLSRPAAMLLGLLVGGGVSAAAMLVHYLAGNALYHAQAPAAPAMPWLDPGQDLKLFLIYGTTGLLYGWLYYRWISAKQPAAGTFS